MLRFPLTLEAQHVMILVRALVLCSVFGMVAGLVGCKKDEAKTQLVQSK